MKYIFKVLAIAALGAGLVSCADFLDEKITTSYAGDNMLSTESALDANLLNCYKSLNNGNITNGVNMESLLPASGIIHWGIAYSSSIGNTGKNYVCNLKFTRYSKSVRGGNLFSYLYQCIYQCNALIRSLTMSPVDEEFKKHIDGEARFIRSYAYFQLVRLYGDVSLITIAPTSVEETYTERTNFWEVYCQIVKDLETCEKELYDFATMKAAYGNGSYHVCNYAATAMKSLVYLTIGTLLEHPHDNFWLEEKRTPDFSEIDITSAKDAFEKARDAAEDVIANGPFKLAPSFQRLFHWSDPEDWQLEERIFVSPVTPEGGGGTLAAYTLPNYYLTTTKTNGPRTRPTRWLFQKWCECYGGSKGTGSNNKNIYINSKDPRFDVTFIRDSYLYNGTTKKYIYPHSDSKTSNERVYNLATTNITNYGIPFCKKYWSPDYDGTIGKADVYIMRFAEVYLIAAEAEAYLCESPADEMGQKAMANVNKILERARNSKTLDGTGTPSTYPLNWTTEKIQNVSNPTKEDLLTAIFWERCFELCFEQHEYYDTHRCGAQWIIDHISVPKNEFLNRREQTDGERTGLQGFRTYMYGSADFQYSTVKEEVRKGLICAYPHDELIYNKKLSINLHDPNKGQNPEEVFWE